VQEKDRVISLATQLRTDAMADLTTIQNRLTALESDLLACQTEIEPTPPQACVATLDGPQTSASINFTPPASDGGSPITGYEAVSTPGGFSASGVAAPLVVAGLDGAASEYTFEVRAVNAVGHSLPCVTAAVGTNGTLAACQQIFAGTTFILLVGGQGASALRASANDAASFQIAETLLFGNPGNAHGVAYGAGNRWVAVGTGSGPSIRIAHSDGGLDWTLASAGAPTGTQGRAVASDGAGNWVAVVSGTSAFSVTASSNNGVAWTSVPPTFALMNDGFAVAYDGVGRWMAGGSVGGTTHALIASDDAGATWAAITLPFTWFVLSAIAYSAGRWIIGGTPSAEPQQTMAYSDDGGTTWTLLPVGQPFTSQTSAIASDGAGNVVAGGSSGSASLAYSSDNGLTWTDASSPAGGTTITYGVSTSGNGTWAATYGINPHTLYSTDNGATWTPGGYPNFIARTAIAYARQLPL
jgi:hypothetical protein